MSDCIKCNLCSKPGSLADSIEVSKASCHQRKYADHQFTVWRCNNCNSIHSKEDVDLDKYYCDYSFHNQKLNFPTALSYKNRLKELRKLGFSKKSSLLDYGCSAGLFVRYLREKGYQNVFGYDPYVEEFTEKAVLKNQYDFVTSYDVIEHVKNPVKMFQGLTFLLKSDGILVLGTPNADKIALKDKLGDGFSLSQPFHRHILSEKVLRELSAKSSMKVLKTSSRFYFDTLVPGINSRFIWNYTRRNGNHIDVLVEPIKVKSFFRYPGLIFDMFVGYFLPPKENLTLFLRSKKG